MLILWINFKARPGNGLRRFRHQFPVRRHLDVGGKADCWRLEKSAIDNRIVLDRGGDL